MAPKYLLRKKIIQEGVQLSTPAGAQGKGLQHQQDGKKVQGDWKCPHFKPPGPVRDH